jgi:hypothetical protein
VILDGHLHSYYAFDNAHIPTFISRGGAPKPERLVGIGPHYLMARHEEGEYTDLFNRRVTVRGMVRLPNGDLTVRFFIVARKVRHLPVENQ